MKEKTGGRKTRIRISVRWFFALLVGSTDTWRSAIG